MEKILNIHTIYNFIALLWLVNNINLETIVKEYRIKNTGNLGLKGIWMLYCIGMHVFISYHIAIYVLMLYLIWP